MADQPRVSVVLPVFNAEKYLSEAVGSILAQSLGDFELIAIDDGSTDASRSMLEAFAARDARVRVVSRENRGFAASLNEGILLARAPLVAIMNADDISLPERLAKQAAYLDAHPGVAAVGSQTRMFFDAAGPHVQSHLPQSPAAVRKLINRASPLAHPAVMMRRQAAIDIGLYRPQLFMADDYDLWLRLAEKFDLANLPEVLLRYRLHAEQSTANRDEAIAVSTVATQAASRERRAGRPDPIDAAASLDARLLARLGIQESDIARHILASALSRSESLLVVGASPAQAFGPLGSLAGHWAAVKEPRRYAAYCRWLEARVAVRNDELLAALKHFMAAMAGDPALLGRVVRRLVRRFKGMFNTVMA